MTSVEKDEISESDTWGGSDSTPIAAIAIVVVGLILIVVGCYFCCKKTAPVVKEKGSDDNGPNGSDEKRSPSQKGEFSNKVEQEPLDIVKKEEYIVKKEEYI
jgi:hypothetical protein